MSTSPQNRDIPPIHISDSEKQNMDFINREFNNFNNINDAPTCLADNLKQNNNQNKDKNQSQDTKKMNSNTSEIFISVMYRFSNENFLIANEELYIIQDCIKNWFRKRKKSYRLYILISNINILSISQTDYSENNKIKTDKIKIIPINDTNYIYALPYNYEYKYLKKLPNINLKLEKFENAQANYFKNILKDYIETQNIIQNNLYTIFLDINNLINFSNTTIQSQTGGKELYLFDDIKNLKSGKNVMISDLYKGVSIKLEQVINDFLEL